MIDEHQNPDPDPTPKAEGALPPADGQTEGDTELLPVADATTVDDGEPSTVQEVDPEAFRSWFDARKGAWAAAQRQLENALADFHRVWTEQLDFEIESVENARVKDIARVLAKFRRRGLRDPEDLLREVHDPGDGVMRYPVQDLIGVRVLVKSLDEVARYREAVDEQTIGERLLAVDDKNKHPSETAYRALHIDGTVEVQLAPGEFIEVPYELQIKTLAQHVFGQHTHDEAYVPDSENDDARYALVRELQATMAEQLNVVDRLQVQIAQLSSNLRAEISANPAGDDITYATVLNVVRDLHSAILTFREAQDLADRALAAGITSRQEFEAILDPEAAENRDVPEELERILKRRPTIVELMGEMLNGRVRAREAVRRREEEFAAEGVVDPNSAPVEEEGRVAPETDESPPMQ